MLHLVDKIYFDYAFSGTIGRDTVLFIGEPAQYEYREGIIPLGQFPSLEALLAEYGDIATFLECLVPLQRKTHLLLDEATLNQLLVLWLRSVFPAIRVEMVHRFLKLNVVNHKYEHGSRTNTRGQRKVGLRALTFPSPADTQAWFDWAAGAPDLAPALKTRVSFEYLLAHALAVDFAECDPYVQALVARMETVLWKSIAWDFVETRRDMLYGMYNLKANFGLPLDLEREDIDEQVAALKDCVVFHPDNHPGNVEFIKAHRAQIHTYAQQVALRNGNYDSTFNLLMETLAEAPFTLTQAKQLIARDRTMHCSQIFGRTEFRDNMNNSFISYLYQASPGELAELCFNGDPHVD